MTDRQRGRALRRGLRRRLAPALAFLICVLGAALLARAPALLRGWQERAFDHLILSSPPPAATGAPVLVVDIGAADETGKPWDRTASARLAARIAAAGPAAVGYDIVFAGDCGGQTANAALAAGLSRSPVVLGFLLSGVAGPPPAPAPALAVAEPAALHLWSAPGAEAPCPEFTGGLTSLGALSLPGDDTARVRMVPAAVLVAGAAYPSLPVELLRRAGDLPVPLISAGPETPLALRLGDLLVPLEPGGVMRFHPASATVRAARTVDAAAVLAGEVAAERLAGALVLVGSSLPQRGGLRPTSVDPLYPSVQIAADVTLGLAAGQMPYRSASGPGAEALALILGGGVLALLLGALAPVAAFAAALGLGAAWALGAVVAQRMTGMLIDPVFPALGLILAALVSLLAQAAASTRAERVLRQRMGQLLPAPVIARLIEEPQLLRLKGEARVVTALFTDLEGFSATASQLAPEALIALLDRYFAVISAVVLRHGGMIDKIVGDAVHALFNAPLDQPGHVDAALAAAADIFAETEALRRDPALAGLGRTRIGVETGPAILGDVGSGARIDYTAHGAAVNLAARLQEAGKVLGPSVIIGPGSAALTRTPLRPLGLAEVRSFGRLNLFTLP